jgi:hypothetical protein
MDQGVLKMHLAEEVAMMDFQNQSAGKMQFQQLVLHSEPKDSSKQ